MFSFNGNDQIKQITFSQTSYFLPVTHVLKAKLRKPTQTVAATKMSDHCSLLLVVSSEKIVSYR